MWHLLTHTSGLTYGFHYAHPRRRHLPRPRLRVRRAAGHGPRRLRATLWARLPLLFEPGTEFNYCVSTDVLGRVVEVLSGQPLDVVPQGAHPRPARACTTPRSGDADAAPAGRALRAGPGAQRPAGRRRAAARRRSSPAAAGWSRTAADYHRFTRMLLGGGELDGTRLLGTRTLRYMGRNHLPGGAELKAVARPTISETQNEGMGFGLGFSVVLDPARTKVACSEGELAWGGLASTAFWVDPTGAHRGAVLHPAGAVEHLPAALAAAHSSSTRRWWTDCTPSSSASPARTRASAPS